METYDVIIVGGGPAGLKCTEELGKTNSQVSRIEANKVILKDGREYAYKYLVGAERYASLVRRYLKLPAAKK